MDKLHPVTLLRLLHSLLFCFAALLHPLVAGAADSEVKPIKIGVLATRGAEQCLKTWGKTADFLTAHIPDHRFLIEPLTHDRIASSVRSGEVDFILTNPSFYVELEQQYGINRIATLKELRLGRAYSRYGGVIFTRAGRTDVRTLADLKGKSFMAVSEGSLGGWQMAWREFKEKGIDPLRDFKSLKYGETHDSVVYAVRDGLIDAGTVRTNTLEELSAEGKIRLADFFVFPRIHSHEEETPYLCTTREYPDWPMAKVRTTPDELAEKVAVALLQMRPDSPAAIDARCAGWTIPLNYQPVMELMMALKLGPYRDLGKVTIVDVVRHYGPWLFITFAGFCSLAIFTGLVVKLNRRIKASQVSLMAEIEMHKKLDNELEQAKRLAEAATMAKSRFLANMSHEIRTPMNGIIAATDLALAEPLTPEVEHYLHIVQNSSYSLLGIINDILDFSKIEAGQLELKERIFRLDEMFDRVMDVFVSQAAEKEIELLVDIDPATPRLLNGDSLRLQQILTNLVSNAVKFTSAGGIILVSVCEVVSPQGPEDDRVVLFFTVKDTGAGIGADYLPMLFEPFTQEDSSSTRKHEGTGLGLSICKKFVTMMNGSISVTTELGKGSTFSFTVVLGRAATTLESRFVFPPDISGLNVLVVDDCSDSRTIMDKMLASLGFCVETVTSAAEAIARLQQTGQKKVELVFMDWKMAGMDGLQATRVIREELLLNMPIILMTAFAREVHRSDAEKVGTNGFLTKPIFQSTLFDAVMDAFGKAGPARASAENPFTTKASMYKHQLSGCRVLVVEDNLTNQEVARAILGSAGIDVTLVGNGEEAVARVAEESFDAVLMDVQMPKMNGYEATKKIRMLPGRRSLPIIAMTAHALKGDEEKCLEAGMDAYISKPINQERLFYTLWRRLTNRHRSEEVRENTGPLPPGEENSRSVADHCSTEEVQVPGIDVGSVLQSTGLNWPTFLDILGGFLKDNIETLATLQQALETMDRPALTHIAHSLKGSAGNIGAGELREAAAELEQGCGENLGEAEIGQRCLELQKELSRIFTVLEPLVREAREKAPPAGPPPAEGESLLPLLATLTGAIDRADPEEISRIAEEVVGTLTARHLVEEAVVSALQAEIRRYDYDQALKTIGRIQRTVEEHA